MKKLLWLALGAAGALLVKTVLDRRRRERLEGALPRPLPREFDGEVLSALDELRGPLAEV
jgi:hypothetical protein